MVGSHQLDRLASKDAHAVQPSSVQQHLRETRIVRGGGKHTAEQAIAGDKALISAAGLFCRLRSVAHDDTALLVPLMLSHQAVELGWLTIEGRILHDERLENPLVHE